MTEEEDGTYTFTVVLGETRIETFYICLGGIPDYSFYPACNMASSKIYIEGPDDKGVGKRWCIDGRDEEVPAGTVYKISFFWGQIRKKISWEEVGAENAPKVLRHEHKYQIMGSWTSGRKDELKKGDGIFEFRSKIGVTGREEFILIRDGDDQQMIYPAEPNCTKTTVPVRGPDHMGAGKMWVVTGPVGELVKVRLEIDDGKIIVAVISKSLGEKVWESVEGYDRHSYWLSFQGGPVTKMTMDPEMPGVFRARAQIGSNFNEEYKGLCEFFNVIVDEDPNIGFFPDVACASTGECVVWGAQRFADCPFLAKSWQVGAGFEVTLNLKIADKRKIVTWAWDTPPSFNYSAVMDA
mmetsp:Transcript_3368/g.5177  ORF Transcript_3368/g.5177 Transcript_3368/m.5177 type:complete len:352 (-) Transcript_3368:156-1211(-)